MSTEKSIDPELERVTRKTRKDWEIVPAGEAAVASSRLGAMISVRFEPDVAKVIRQAARLEGITQSEFVRRSAEAAARSIVDAEPITVERYGADIPALIWEPSTSSRPRQERVISTLTSPVSVTKR
jgi:hypothetical protein